MNKKVVIAVIVLLALLGIGAFALSSKKDVTTSDQIETNNSTSESTTAGTTEKSLKDLFASGSSQKCTFSLTDATQSMGTVYVASGKVRGDFTVSVEGKDMTTHMIGDGTTSYIWTDGQSTGFKMAFDPTTDTQKPTNTQSQPQSMDVNAKMNYNCSAWTTDQSMFAVPTSVKFTEMNIPKSGTSVNGGANNDMKVQQCAACDNAPESARAQCKAALGC